MINFIFNVQIIKTKIANFQNIIQDRNMVDDFNLFVFNIWLNTTSYSHLNIDTYYNFFLIFKKTSGLGDILKKKMF